MCPAQTGGGSLRMDGHGHYIEGRWIQGAGKLFTSTNPATGREVWHGPCATPEEVDQAVISASHAFEGWSRRTVKERIDYLNTFKRSVKIHAQPLAEVISLETGKPLWEATQEVHTLENKVDLTLEAFQERRSPEKVPMAGVTGSIHYRPVGTFAVLGPFNMPAHLPNGHIIPALLSGNTVVYKPSRFTPRTAETYLSLWEEAEIPPGVITLIQGDRDSVATLIDHPGIDGLLFTGSYETGKRLHKAFAGKPEKTVVLEMGGNNPLIVHDVEDMDSAVVYTILSAYITAGQRCTCARRLIVQQGPRGDAFVDRLAHAVKCIQVGSFTDRPEPFHGPVISNESAEKLLTFQEKLLRSGAESLLEMKSFGLVKAMMQPGLIDVTAIRRREDSEIFGPLLQLVRVPDFTAAITEARGTSYGLAAGLLCDNPALYDLFSKTVPSGHLVWNRQTTGASGRLPFGGLGTSGNHRPSGYFAVDYCSDAVASLVNENLERPSELPPGLEKLTLEP